MSDGHDVDKVIRKKMENTLMKRLIFIVILALVGEGCLYAQGLIELHRSFKDRMEDEALKSAMRLPKTDADVVVEVGDVFLYSAREHRSIGKFYKLEYDKEAFEVRCKTRYDNPGLDGRVKPGGDSGGKTSIFTAKKRGEYEIKVIKMNKTKVKKIITYKVSVIDGE